MAFFPRFKGFRRLASGLLVYLCLFVLAWVIVCAHVSVRAAIHSAIQPSAIQPTTPHAKAAVAAISPSAIALTPLEAGLQRYAEGRFSEAIEHWRQALAESQEQANVPQQAASLRYLSLAYQKLGRWRLAQRAISESLELLASARQEQAQSLLLAQILTTQGTLQLTLGQPEAALETWKRAEQTYGNAGDDAGQLGSQINQAQALQALGLFRRARSLLDQVNATLQTQPDSKLKALVLRSLGSVLQVIGDLRQAQSVLQQSLAIAQQLDPPLNVSGALFALGNTARALQDAASALAYYQQAAETASTQIDRLNAQLSRLSLLIDTQQWETAQGLATHIQPQLTTLEPTRQSIYAQVNFAASVVKFQKSHGSKPASDLSFDVYSIAQQLGIAAQQARDLQDLRAESYALGQLGSLYEQAQQWNTAQKLTQQALLLAQQANALDIAYRWEWQMGRILKQPGKGAAHNNLVAAIAAYTEAVETLKSIRRDLLAVNPESQFLFREEVEPVYRELVELLVGPDASSAHLRQAREVIEALQIAELENFFRSACVEPFRQIDSVDEQAAILYPILLPRQLVVILSLPGQALRYHTVQVPLEQVETLLANLRRNLILPYTSQAKDINPLSQQLYQWMIEPVASAIADSGVETLVFVLDGALRNVPISVLHDGQHYLVEHYNIALAPGLQLIEPRPLAQLPLRALTAGLTESRNNFAPLEFVELELAQIEAEIPSKTLLNQAFTTVALETEIESSAFPVVHIATHGQFSSQSNETFILAWDHPITIDALDELLQTRKQGSAERLELLVLSACETADGDQRASLGLAGVAVRAGARSTLASLWLVDDESTALLMNQFYQGLKAGLPKAKALRQAQLTLLKGEYQHPRFWGAFVLLGNWL